MQKYDMLEEFDKIILQSKSILREYDLCDNCLGRFFISSTHWSSGRRLGNKIRVKAVLTAMPPTITPARPL